METDTTKAAPSTAAETPQARFIRGCLNNLVWFVPFVLIGWPVIRELPPTLVCYCAISIVGAGLVAGLADPVSLRNRQGQDRATELIVGLCTLIALIWAAVDFGRLHISNSVSPVVRWIALAVLLAAYALRIWAVVVNQFFAGLLVIQEDRGHQVVDTGPYALVRHPGNLSIVLIVLCGPLAVNSYLAFIPMGIAFLAMLKRTRLEDRFLHENLPGYGEYAGRVRYRLMPGLW
ncbi:MAG: isoprenylcysteine carboxylmethyltransferase family protein [Phycisphaerales bacterium]|nr:MAG: isoprenylcysteine carboxylmethyltransferase family protein [Phycisphaerales bacterium]